MTAAQVYVAGYIDDVTRVREVQAIVREYGGEITFDWTGPDGEARNDWSEHPDRARMLATYERNAIADADFVILVLHPTRGLGCYIEIGMALAQELPVLLLGEGRESVFWYLPGVERIPDTEALRTRLAKVFAMKTGCFADSGMAA